MIIEGYAIVFNQETLIGDREHGFTEVIDPTIPWGADLEDVPLKYNHTDNRLILSAELAMVRLPFKLMTMGSRKIRAELIDTQSNRDVYKSIVAGPIRQDVICFYCQKSKLG